ncbi:MAG TPA: NAD(P)H-binding protein [Planctomycetota bacterium]|nr:NAD(P)H-binding protein [Planctomycetota bacterium]
MQLLVTGGTGHLGRLVVRGALAAGHGVRIASRRPQPLPMPLPQPAQPHPQPAQPQPQPKAEWTQLDLATATVETLGAALAGVDAVVHAASDARRSKRTDVEGSRRLFEAARQARVSHLLFVSIVGVDQNPLTYYRHKLQTETDLAASGLPHSILRATQFHWFVDYLLAQAARAPFVMLVPAGFHVQGVDEEEVAARILRALGEGPGGRLRDFAGPEPMTLAAAVATWKGVRRVKKAVLPLWLPGGAAAAFRAGSNTSADGDKGTLRWKDWLRGHAQSRAAS